MYLGKNTENGTYFFNNVKTKSSSEENKNRRCSVKNGVLKNFTVFTGKHLCWSLLLIKLQACNFVKKETLAQVFCVFTPVNFVKFLRTPFLKEHLRWLFLNNYKICFW